MLSNLVALIAAVSAAAVGCSSNDPVCSTVPRYYSNICLLNQSGKPRSLKHLAIKGKCLACNAGSGAVCSTSGGVYANECVLAGKKLTKSPSLVAYKGQCLACSFTSGPVCSDTTGIWFANSCALQATGATVSPLYVATNGTCKIVCASNLPPNPVCSNEGVLYNTYCNMIADGKELSENHIYNPWTGQCEKGVVQDTSAYLKK